MEQVLVFLCCWRPAHLVEEKWEACVISTVWGSPPASEKRVGSLGGEAEEQMLHPSCVSWAQKAGLER
jgi:hypothetical protein